MGMDNKRTIEIYTDGAARPANPGEGAYGFVVSEKYKIIHEEASCGGHTTSNIMELTAAIKSLEWCIANGYDKDIIYMYLDSQYVQRGITEWIDKWIKRKWKTGSRDPVANKELWERLLELKNQVDVTFQWIRGHSGIPMNEKVDEMCTKLLDEKLNTKNDVDENQVKT
jgi:ribonuclease HI